MNNDTITVNAVNKISIKPLQIGTVSLPFELRSPPEGYEFEFAFAHHRMGLAEKYETGTSFIQAINKMKKNVITIARGERLVTSA